MSNMWGVTKKVHGNNASFQEQLSTVNHHSTQNRLLEQTTHDSPLKPKYIIDASTKQ